MKVGILGGGQLGRMLLQAAINYPVETYVMENDPACPSAHLCHHFIKGDIKDYDAVYNFGKELDALTIEIEAVNVDALERLESIGVKVIPNSAAIRTIKSKILQKEFYKVNSIASPEFVVTNTLEELKTSPFSLPAVHKIAMGGYDGRGVHLIQKEDDVDNGFDAPAVLEKMVDIKQEIAVMVAMNEIGETAVYPAVEMLVDSALNLLDFQLSPALLPENILAKASSLALEVLRNLNSPGLFAIEMFLDHEDNVWVNETAPRVHNSGHHTIEANFCSQFDMLWRIILGYPLGNTASILPSAIVNIVGSEDEEGLTKYAGLEQVLQLPNVFVHLYGKQTTKPGRKMGHVTILASERQELIEQAQTIKKVLRVVADKE